MTHLDILECALIALLALYVWRVTRTLDCRAQVASVEATFTKAVAEMRVRQDAMAQDMSRSPTQRDHSDLLTKLARMEANQDHMARELHAARQSQARIEDFLMKQSRKLHHDSQF